MGCTLSAQSPENADARLRSIKIDEAIRVEKSSGPKVIKILILGAGESGKSTFVKQMKIINMKGYSQQELLDCRSDIFHNVVDNAKQMIKAMDRLGAQVSDDRLKEHIDIIRNYNAGVVIIELPHDFCEALRYMWNEGGVRDLYSDLSGAAYMIESAPYFFESIERIGRPNYVPTEMDVIKSRVKTTGICEIRFNLTKDKDIHMYDVGGQRSERKKWIHCFENVTSVLFMTALSEYNQSLLEDISQNRLVESLILFNSIVNSQWFAHSSIILFLNKMDVFKEKIKKIPLKNYVTDYTDVDEFEPAAAFIRKKFVKLNKGNLQIYAHYTCCTDTTQIKFVFQAIKITLLNNSLANAGFVEVKK